MIHDRPRCLDCHQTVEHDPIYAAPCGHERCPSAVWHGTCLMSWRERRAEAIRRFRAWLEGHVRPE